MTLLTHEMIEARQPKKHARATSRFIMRQWRRKHHELVSFLREQDRRMDEAMDRAIADFERELIEAGF